MKCAKCKYLGKENFENTTLKTCKCIFYLIERAKKEGIKNLYSTDSLVSEENNCLLEKYLEKLIN